MVKKPGRPKLGPLVKYQRQVMHELTGKQRGRPSYVPESLLPKVIDFVALLKMESKIRGRKITVQSAVRRAVDALTDDMSSDLLAFIAEAAKVDYRGNGRLPDHRKVELAKKWLVTVNVEIKKLYGLKKNRR